MPFFEVSVLSAKKKYITKNHDIAYYKSQQSFILT